MRDYSEYKTPLIPSSEAVLCLLHVIARARNESLQRLKVSQSWRRPLLEQWQPSIALCLKIVLNVK